MYDFFKSVLKTKHSAVLLTCEQQNACRLPASNLKQKVILYDLRMHNIDRLRYCLAVFPWNQLMQCSDIESLYTQFVDTVLDIVSKTVPFKPVVLGNKDPEFVTPLIESLLRQRNKLRRHGRLDAADAVAHEINFLICKNRANSLSKLTTATTKQLWSAVNKTRNASASEVV